MHCRLCMYIYRNTMSTSSWDSAKYQAGVNQYHNMIGLTFSRCSLTFTHFDVACPIPIEIATLLSFNTIHPISASWWRARSHPDLAHISSYVQLKPAGIYFTPKHYFSLKIFCTSIVCCSGDKHNFINPPTTRLRGQLHILRTCLEASSLPLDLAMLAMPLLWLVAVVTARNLRLWTRTLLSASVLAVFTGAWQRSARRSESQSRQNKEGEKNLTGQTS